jgi:hypothetical protein
LQVKKEALINIKNGVILPAQKTTISHWNNHIIKNDWYKRIPTIFH